MWALASGWLASCSFGQFQKGPQTGLSHEHGRVGPGCPWEGRAARRALRWGLPGSLEALAWPVLPEDQGCPDSSPASLLTGTEGDR